MKKGKENCLDGFVLNEEENQNKFIGVIIMEDDQEIHFDDDNVSVICEFQYHSLLQLANFEGELSFLNGIQFTAEQNKMCVIKFSEC